VARKIRMPHCVGQYEPKNDVCNGDPSKSKDTEDGVPCWCRDRCIALRLWCGERGKEPDHFVALQIVKENGVEMTAAVPKMSNEIFANTLDKTIANYGVINGRITRPNKGGAPKKKIQAPAPTRGKPGPKKGKRPCVEARVKSRRAVIARAKARREECKLLFGHFKKHLEVALHGQKWSARNSAIAADRLYIKDRFDNSGYATVYCKTRIGRDTPVVTARLKTATLTLMIGLPVTLEQLESQIGKATCKKLSPYRILDGYFITAVNNVDKERAALIAETIGRLVKSGIINLPAAAQ